MSWCCLQHHSLSSVHPTSPAHVPQDRLQSSTKAKGNLRWNSEVTGSWHYPEAVCQHFSLAKGPLYYRNTDIFCFDIIMVWREELLKKYINPFQTVLRKNPESRAGTAAP